MELTDFALFVYWRAWSVWILFYNVFHNLQRALANRTNNSFPYLLSSSSSSSHTMDFAASTSLACVMQKRLARARTAFSRMT